MLSRALPTAVGVVVVATVLAVGTNSPAGATGVSDEATLRAAFGDPSSTTVTLSADVTLTDCGGAVERNSSTPLTVAGNGFTVKQTCTDRVFDQTGSGTVTFTDLIVTGGFVDSDESGGRIYGGGIAAAGDVVLRGTTVTGNAIKVYGAKSAPGEAYGGGVSAMGSLTVDHSTISGNFLESGAERTTPTSFGGGLYAYGDLWISNSTVSGNTAQSGDWGRGGGFLSDTGNVVITGSSVLGNHATGADGHAGGGEANLGSLTLTSSTVADNVATGSTTALTGGVSAATVTVVNSTVSGNSATGVPFGNAWGGGISALNLKLVYATIADNSAPDGANLFGRPRTDFSGPTLNIDAFASVIASPQGGGQNCDLGDGGQVVRQGYEYPSDASCGYSPSLDPLLLGPLADNGGPTLTRGPQPGSVLIDAVGAAFCQYDGASGIVTDQRGSPRPAAGGNCDVGAVEVQPAGPTAPPPTTPPACGRSGWRWRGGCTGHRDAASAPDAGGLQDGTRTLGAAGQRAPARRLLEPRTPRRDPHTADRPW